MIGRDLISVLIPFYNAESYLRKCIESVLFQTYQNLELILVDDGSSDESLVICHEYALIDSRIKICSLSDNKGPGLARQFGIAKATGKYLTFIDSDDVFVKEALEVLYSAMGETTDLVVAQHMRISQDIVNVKQIQFKAGNFILTNKNRAKYFGRDFFEYVHGVELWNKLFRLEIAKRCWKDPIDLKIGEDLFMLFKYLLYCNEIICVDATTYIYDFRSSSLARSTFLLLQEFAKNALDVKDQISKNDTVRKIYPFIMYRLLSVALTKYKMDTNEAKEKLISDFEALHKLKGLVSLAKEYLFSPEYIFKRNYFLPENYGRFQALCIYSAILTGDAWYYTKLYPGLIAEKGSFLIILKVIIKKTLFRVKNL